MATLIEQLTEKTQDLKATYLEQVRVWAKNDFERIERLSKWYQTKEAYQNKDRYYQAQKFLYRSGYSTLQNGVEKYVEKELKNAELHYEQSIEKLVFRLNKKGVVDGSDFVITSGRVGVNFECRIEHDGKVTKAWTIIAEGAIQRPHYRYLVK